MGDGLSEEDFGFEFPLCSVLTHKIAGRQNLGAAPGPCRGSFVQKSSKTVPDNTLESRKLFPMFVNEFITVLVVTRTPHTTPRTPAPG